MHQWTSGKLVWIMLHRCNRQILVQDTSVYMGFIPQLLPLGYFVYTANSLSACAYLSLTLRFPRSYTVSSPVPITGDHNTAHGIAITNFPYGTAFSSIKPHYEYEYLIFPHKLDLKDNIFLFGQQQPQPLFILNTSHLC